MNLAPIQSGSVVFDSDAFIVVAAGSEDDRNIWYEVCIKAEQPEICFLTGDAAMVLYNQTQRWQQDTPSLGEVEMYLYNLTQLGRWPLRADN